MKKIFIIIIFVVSSVYLIADDIDAIYDPIITPIYTGRTLFCSVMTDDIDKTPCDPESRHIVYSTNVIDTVQGVMSFRIHFDTINLEPNKELTVKEITSLQFIRCDKPEFDISTLLPEFYEELHLWHWWLGDYVNPLTMYPEQQWTAKFIVIPCNTALGQVVEHIATHSYEGYIFPCTHLIAGMFPMINSSNLNTTQINKAEDILKKHILDIKKQCCNINRCTIKKYKRQYWGTINEDGHIVVNICLINNKLVKQIDIREDIINIQDGGCDVIRLSVDLETEGIVIKINGVA